MRARSAPRRSRSAADPRSPSAGTSGTRPAIRSVPTRSSSSAPSRRPRGSWTPSRSRSRGATSCSASAGAGTRARRSSSASTPKAAQRAGLKALDKPDAEGYVAVKVAIPSGSDVLQETTWDLGAAGRQDADRPGREGPPPPQCRRHEAPPPARRPRPPHAQAAAAVPAAAVGLGRHPLPPDGPGRLRRAARTATCTAPSRTSARAWRSTAYDAREPAPADRRDPRRQAPQRRLARDERLDDAEPAGPDDELGFRGWPAFDDRTHLKTHQDWIRRAYDGGQRLMVALIVHNQMLASLSTASQLLFRRSRTATPSSRRSRCCSEFVAHNGAWCGIADEARRRARPDRGQQAGLRPRARDRLDQRLGPRRATSRRTRRAVHPAIHDYFAYLQKLGVVQVNLIHLTDNAFGGMALYNRLFMINSFTRRGVLPDIENGWTAHTMAEEKISAPVDIATVPWEHLEPELTKLGIPWPAILPAGTLGPGRPQPARAHGRPGRSRSTRRCGSGWWWTWTTCPRRPSTRRTSDAIKAVPAPLPADLGAQRRPRHGTAPAGDAPRSRWTRPQPGERRKPRGRGPART